MKPLNVIIDNVISRLMWSNCPQIEQVPNSYKLSTFYKYSARHIMGSRYLVSAAYWDHISQFPLLYINKLKWPVNVITLSDVVWPKVIP